MAVLLTPPRRRRWLRGLSLLALMSAAAYTAWLLFNLYELKQAMAEADRLDPGWSWEELEAKRVAVPADQNAALLILRLSRQWPYGGKATGVRYPVPPPARLPAAYLAELQSALAQAEPVLAEARRLAELGRGRFPLQRPTQRYPESGAMWSHTPASWLRADALARIESGDFAGALVAVRGIITCSRAIGDEPTGAQTTRALCRDMAVEALERLLAQAEVSAADLAALQAHLEADEADDLWLIEARGERAIRFLLGDFDPLRPMLVFLVRYRHFLMPPMLATRLRRGTALVEALKRPEPERSARVAALQPDSPVAGSGRSFRLDNARMRCAIAGLAAERYRQASGRWPGSLDELVSAGLLRTVPADPYDGQPLRLVRADDGLIVYAVGEDRTDNGGRLEWGGARPGYDLGFRLWDPPARRQPAPPGPPKPARPASPPPAGTPQP